MFQQQCYFANIKKNLTRDLSLYAIQIALWFLKLIGKFKWTCDCLEDNSVDIRLIERKKNHDGTYGIISLFSCSRIFGCFHQVNKGLAFNRSGTLDSNRYKTILKFVHLKYRKTVPCIFQENYVVAQ